VKKKRKEFGKDKLKEMPRIEEKELNTAVQILQELDKKIDKRWVRKNVPQELIREKEKLASIVSKMKELLGLVEENEKSKMIDIFKD